MDTGHIGHGEPPRFKEGASQGIGAGDPGGVCSAAQQGEGIQDLIALWQLRIGTATSLNLNDEAAASLSPQAQLVSESVMAAVRKRENEHMPELAGVLCRHVDEKHQSTLVVGWIPWMFFLLLVLLPKSVLLPESKI